MTPTPIIHTQNVVMLPEFIKPEFIKPEYHNPIDIILRRS